MAVRQIEIGGRMIGIVDLDEILEEVKSLAPPNDDKLQRILLEKAGSKNWIPPGMEKDYGAALLEEYMVFTGRLAQRPVRRLYPEIRVYGAGCPNCMELDKRVTKALTEMDLKADYLYVKDLKEIAANKILAAPAMTINGKIVAAGKVPSVREITEIIRKNTE